MKTNRMQLMSEGDVSKSLFKLGIPMVVSMLVTALYNVVDTYFVSGLGTQQVAAVSVAFPISFIFSASDMLSIPSQLCIYPLYTHSNAK